MASCVVAVVLLATVSVAFGACPNILPYRSTRVTEGFDPAKLTGFWYEAAYIDVAQLGASCQTLNSTFDAASGDVTMAFKVDYGPVPFTIREEYVPANASEPGYYIKHAEMPGGSLLKLPTVVVDVTLSADGSQYDTMTLFSCISPVGVQVTELVFAGRKASMPSTQLAALEATARAQGVSWKQSDLKTVDWSKCKAR